MALSKHDAVTETMSDERLAELARAGDEDAFATLVQRCAPIIKRQAMHLRGDHFEMDDLAQEGLMGLFSAVRTFDPGYASFRTYASVCIRNRMLSFVQRSGAASQIPSSELISMDDEEQAALALAGCSEDPAHLVVQKEEVSILHGRLREILSLKEYDVLMLYMRAYAYEEIAQQLSMSIKAVDNALQRVRRKLVTFSLFGGQ